MKRTDSDFDNPRVEECLDSEEGRQEFFSPSNSTGRLHYLAKGYETWTEAYEAVWRKAPEYYGTGNLAIKTITVKPVPGATGLWDGVVDYGFNKKNFETYFKHRGSTTGGTKHINTSLKTHMAKSAVLGMPDIDFGGAIGVTEKGDVEGVDVVCPAGEWSVTKVYSPAEFQAAFRFLMRMSGRINADSFWGFLPGEVLFKGIDYDEMSKQADESNYVVWFYVVTFHFSALEGQYGTGVGDLIFDKRGWDYAWVYYESRTDGKDVQKFPRQVNVEQVYRECYFSEFGLPSF